MKNQEFAAIVTFNIFRKLEKNAAMNYAKKNVSSQDLTSNLFHFGPWNFKTSNFWVATNILGKYFTRERAKYNKKEESYKNEWSSSFSSSSVVENNAHSYKDVDKIKGSPFMWCATWEIGQPCNSFLYSGINLDLAKKALGIVTIGNKR